MFQWCSSRKREKNTVNKLKALESTLDRYGVIHAQPERINKQATECAVNVRRLLFTAYFLQEKMTSWDTTVKLYHCEVLPSSPKCQTVKATRQCVQSERNYITSNLSICNYSMAIISSLPHQRGMHEAVTDICRGPHWVVRTGAVNWQNEVKSNRQVDWNQHLFTKVFRTLRDNSAYFQTRLNSATITSSPAGGRCRRRATSQERNCPSTDGCQVFEPNQTSL